MNSFTKKVIKMDLIDFFIITFGSFFLSFSSCFFTGSCKVPKISFFFPEQCLEFFFQNSSQTIAFFIISLFFSVAYFSIGIYFFNQTIGSKIAQLKFFSLHEGKINFTSALIKGALSFFDVLFFLLSPLYAWCLDEKNLGFSEKKAHLIIIEANLR